MAARVTQGGATIRRLLSRGIAVASILALLGVVATGSGSAKTSGVATVTRSSAVPQQLVGKWSRNVTAAVAKRGVWSIVIGKFAGRDVIGIYAPGAPLPPSPGLPSFVGGISITGNRVSFTQNSGFEYPFCITKGIYRWKASGRSLAFTKVSDRQCPARIAVFVGVWKRQ